MKVHKLPLITVLVALLLSSAWISLAESDTDCEEDEYELVLNIIENPDPISQVQWTGYFGDDNTGDGGRDDGRPDIGFEPHSQDPMVVWSYDAGNDHDIAFLEWIENDWSPDIEFLTHDAADELDPRIFVGDTGSVWVTWWENTPLQSVRFAWRDSATGQWSPPIHVTDGGRRPSVVQWEGQVLVAFERDADAGGQEIALAWQRLDGLFSIQTVTTTERTDPLEIVLHARDGRLWMTWQHSDIYLAYSEFVNGRWVAPDTRPWADRSWLGLLEGRHLIETDLLSID